jgi:hypothetical protein
MIAHHCTLHCEENQIIALRHAHQNPTIAHCMQQEGFCVMIEEQCERGGLVVMHKKI